MYKQKKFEDAINTRMVESLKNDGHSIVIDFVLYFLGRRRIEDNRNDIVYIFGSKL